MQVVERNTILWTYLPVELKGLVSDGESLIDHAIKHGKKGSSDFSYLVFPFAKAYEGFLKKLFLDLNLIKADEYYGDDIRIGRILNPNFRVDRKNIFDRLCQESGSGEQIAYKMWDVWRKGRNQVFHYFPHNFRRLSFDEAMEIVSEIVAAMEVSLESCKRVTQ